MLRLSLLPAAAMVVVCLPVEKYRAAARASEPTGVCDAPRVAMAGLSERDNDGEYEDCDDDGSASEIDDDE
jgi:hypothetical protein